MRDVTVLARRSLKGVANLSRLHLRHRLWRFHPRRFIARWEDRAINRPIFLLGVQGGGLTLTGRMLRRNHDVVSVTGNADFWAGPDEMQSVMGRYLPASLTGLHHHLPPHAGFPERGGLYAIDELLPLYRQTADAAKPNEAHRLRQAIRLVLSIYAPDNVNARFLDKSQTFTVRLGLVNRVLQGTDPRFVLISRNPFAACYRAALVTSPVSRLPLPASERIELAAQHWYNSFRSALDDADSGIPIFTMRFEDLLVDAEARLRALCRFVGLDFHSSMLPGPGDRLPLGSTGSSRGDRKWYPLRPDVNHPYLERLEPWMIDLITRGTGELADRWGYTPFGP
jgi:hypothetical protein